MTLGRIDWRIISIATVLVISAPPLAGQRTAGGNERDSRDLLFAALGVATIECLGTVGPTSYFTGFGVLARTFETCQSNDPKLLQRVDELLGVQLSAQGRADDLAGLYVAAWNAFTESFPSDRIQSCPAWTLMNVIDAPTHESVARYMSRGWVGKENRRYRISAPDCRTGTCAVAKAKSCAGGFGQGFIVAADPNRSLIEVDPAWWLTHYEYADDNPCNPFKSTEDCDPFRSNPYVHGYCTAIRSHPLSHYGALERAGEPCCYWAAGKVYTTGKFEPIDCDDGPDVWYCMTFCMPQ